MTNFQRIAAIVQQGDRPMSAKDIAARMHRLPAQFSGQVSRAATYGYLKAVAIEDGTKLYVVGERR